MPSVPDGRAETPAPHEQPSVRWSPPDAVARPGVVTDVFDALSARDEEVAAWYRGALETLALGGHPDRFAQAAHGLREVMNRVNVLAGVPSPPVGSLGYRFQRLAAAWKRGQERSDCYDENGWNGEIDDPARAAFRVVEETIVWQETFLPSRRESFIRATRTLDASGRTLPESEEDRLWRAWSETKEYFDAVAHHGKQTTDGDFRSELERLDGFILRLFRRDVHAEQRRIATLVERAEHGT